MKVNLFTTLGCHLCDQALALLQSIEASGFTIVINEIEIADDNALLEKYGIRIPVVLIEGHDNDLGWPFTETELRNFLEHPS
ncbi:MAG: glutaredoxin family protein [Pseudomonadales bacterium]|nr:glutaredoxin family protein [Pseudomonadales bacterium]